MAWGILSPRPAVASASRPGKQRRRTLAALLFYGLLALPVVLVLYFALAKPLRVLPRLEPLPAFSLHDQQGRWLADSELRGRALLVNFAFSRCQACTEELTTLSALHARLKAQGQLGEHVQMLTISVDPQHDTPAVLRAYAQGLGADPQGWRFLAGEASEIKALVGGGFGIYYRDGETGAPPGEVERRLVLVDETGLIRARYDAARLELWRIERDLGLLQAEAASSGPTRALYEAAHLFVCYPD
jgi:protein SCO1/2